MLVLLKLKLILMGDFFVVSARAFIYISLCTVLSYTLMALTETKICNLHSKARRRATPL